MAWGYADFYGGARRQGNKLGITNGEIAYTAQLFECLMTNRITILDRQNVLAFFGMSEVTTEAAPFFRRVIAKRAKRPTELVAFFVIRSKPDPGVRYVGFLSAAEYAKEQEEHDSWFGYNALAQSEWRHS